MRRVLIALFVITFTYTYGQDPQKSSYDVKVIHQDYQPLEGDIELGKGKDWQGKFWKIEPGFKMKIFDRVLDKIWVSPAEGSLHEVPNPVQGFGVFAFYTHDGLKNGYSKHNSKVSYKIEGTEGDRILKIQWQNAAFHVDNFNTDYVNFQIWYREKDAHIEYHYGKHWVKDIVFMEHDGPAIGIGLYDEASKLKDGFYLSDDPNHPKIKYKETYLKGEPQPDTVYELTKGSS
ncbi:MAG: hypothetical protein MRY83_19370 [Flavobacteriales bacterium]|nr:hypothetical protein [Flavobacteriales bacterium]